MCLSGPSLSHLPSEPTHSRDAPRTCTLFPSCEWVVGPGPPGCQFLWRSGLGWPFLDLRPQVSTFCLFWLTSTASERWSSYPVLPSLFFPPLSPLSFLLSSFLVVHQRWGLLLILKLFHRGGCQLPSTTAKAEIVSALNCWGICSFWKISVGEVSDIFLFSFPRHVGYLHLDAAICCSRFPTLMGRSLPNSRSTFPMPSSQWTIKAFDWT